MYSVVRVSELTGTETVKCKKTHKKIGDFIFSFIFWFPLLCEHLWNQIPFEVETRGTHGKGTQNRTNPLHQLQ